MAKIAFILLCHKDPEAVIQQARQLTAAGDCIAIHFDARAPKADFAQIRAALADNPDVAFARRRIRCGWGSWSLVQATLYTLQTAVAAFPRATHFYMVSGDCMAIKSAHYAHRLLDDADVDYIESFDFFDSGWIRTGYREERLIYRHFFNERTQKALFYASCDIQRRLGLTRAIPADLKVMIGSQWWCLRRRTIEGVLAFTRARRDVMWFFRTTWIPDETFFQTAVRHLVPATEIRTRTLTFLMFTDYGLPVTFYNDHYDLLLGQGYLFARKISPEAKQLKTRLGQVYASGKMDFQVSDEGRRLFEFLTGQGRVGRRFAPRFWETEASIGRDRELLIVVCKKWHVARRLVAAIAQHMQIATIGYLFNEESTPLPDLGGIEGSLAKRTRHRRALMRMLYDHFGTDRLVICLDPASMDLMQDFASDRATVRLLEIACAFTDDELAAHAGRIGLAGPQTPALTMARLLPAIRYDIMHESDAIRDAGFADLSRIRSGAPISATATALAQFLSVDADMARLLAGTPHLFDD